MSALLACMLLLSPQEETPRAPEIVVTATKEESETFDVPFSAASLGHEELREGPGTRTIATAIEREPGVMGQKTGPGQSSPFLRGFTGFRTLLLVDGIRLNNSVFREGPNQYFGTIDLFSVDRLEMVLGPGSVLWGSDAIGGVLNAVSEPADASDGWHWGYATRYATAERSWQNRLEFEGGEEGEFAIKGGVTNKGYGDIKAGGNTNDLSGTSFDERDWDVRLDVPLEERLDFTLAAQHVVQINVPRTHTTVDSEEWHGTEPGTELRRDLDQQRDLVYGRLSFEPQAGAFFDEGDVTLSFQRQQEDQSRLRTGDKQDESGFDVRTWGTQLELRKDSDIGLLAFGLDNYHDNVDSWRRDFVGGVKTLENIQGPVADDAQYDLFGAYVQDTVVHGEWEHVFGLRYSRAEAEADEVDNPNVAGADPATPGNVIQVDETYDALVGSVRSLKHVSENTNVYAGLSQGFRAPNLSDLTAELTDSGAESPTPDLQPEHFVSLEVGAKTGHESWSAEIALWNQWIRDMVVQSPTGDELPDGTPILVKDNVGDGRLYGFEGRFDYELAPEWTFSSVASYQAGSVDQFETDGEEVDKPISRLMPFTTVLGVTFEPEGESYWLQGDTLIAGEQDQLSLKDETDTQRIPPGGTPGYGILGVRMGVRLDEQSTLGIGLENILNHDYRIHGSGVNEPGRNLVLTYSRWF